MAEQLAGAMGISPESLSDFKPSPVGAADTEPDPLSGTDHPQPRPKPWLRQAHNRKPSYSKAG